MQMRKRRRRPQHYYAHCLPDGTVLAARPVRKPLPKIIKRDHIRIDGDGVCLEFPITWEELRHLEDRFRFVAIMAGRLNTRRAIREMVLPELASIRGQVAALQSQLDRMATMLDGSGE